MKTQADTRENIVKLVDGMHSKDKAMICEANNDLAFFCIYANHRVSIFGEVWA